MQTEVCKVKLQITEWTICQLYENFRSQNTLKSFEKYSVLIT